ncbi:MAG: phosphatidylglycerol lysyltransferase domain-containing protein [Acidobacteriota bacterium]|jgi:hypothetical protein|nr:phosphatidylglycerol lysyltransferase domain-containing protein [Acidobacteriota bacterium]
MQVDASRFAPIHISDQARFHQHLERHPTPSSHYNFAALYCWQDEYQTTWQIADDQLLILNGKTRTLLMPLGPEMPLSALLTLSQSLRKQGLSGRIALIPPHYLERHPQLETHFILERDLDNADYIYPCSQLAELKGRKFSRKRNQIHQFLANHADFISRTLDPEEWPHCRQLAAEWSHKKLEVSLNDSPEFNALQRVFPNCRALGIHGFGLFSARKLVAFSIWSRQNRDTATIHFEKFDPHEKGAAQMINRETAAFLLPWAAWINREQDLGIPGLRKAKSSYLPARLLWGFTATPRDDIPQPGGSITLDNPSRSTHNTR